MVKVLILRPILRSWRIQILVGGIGAVYFRLDTFKISCKNDIVYFSVDIWWVFDGSPLLYTITRDTNHKQ